MREQLKLLENLQQIDVVLQEKKTALTSLPAKLESLKEDVSRLEAALDAERQRLSEAERYRRELEEAIKSNQEQMNKAKARLPQIRTSKEYMATQRELETMRKANQEREDEMLKLMEAIEASKKSVETHDAELASLKQHVSEEEQETSQSLNTLEAEVANLETQRAGKVTGVRKDILNHYSWIQSRLGNAVVPARNGVCTGCNMHLPPQLFIVLQRGETVEHCPSCRRIVYFEAEPEENDG